MLPRYYQNIDADEQVWSKSCGGHAIDGDPVSRPGFDPVRMLFDDLQVRKVLFRLYLHNLIVLTSRYTWTHSSSFMTSTVDIVSVRSGS